MVLVKREYGGGISPSAFKAAYKVGQYLGKRTASYMQSKRRRTTGSQSSKVTNAGPITEQHDLSLRYRRKPMPRYRRRRWRGFTKKVQHVMMQMNPLQTWTFDAHNNENWNVNEQAIFGFMLGGTTNTGNDELLQVFRAAYGAILSATTVDAYKLFIKSLCLDVQITNTGSTNCIVDVYTVIARSSDTVSETIGSQYFRLYGEQDTASVGTPSAVAIASTPFQNGPWLQKWKILSKKEISLGVGTVTTMQMRNAVNRTLQGKALESNPSYIPGYTRAYLFQVRGAPENASGVARCAAGTVTVSRQWTVSYGKPPQAFNTASDI